jgi:hypothetical protein
MTSLRRTETFGPLPSLPSFAESQIWNDSASFVAMCADFDNDGEDFFEDWLDNVLSQKHSGKLKPWEERMRFAFYDECDEPVVVTNGMNLDTVNVAYNGLLNRRALQGHLIYNEDFPEDYYLDDSFYNAPVPTDVAIPTPSISPPITMNGIDFSFGFGNSTTTDTFPELLVTDENGDYVYSDDESVEFLSSDDAMSTSTTDDETDDSMDLNDSDSDLFLN